MRLFELNQQENAAPQLRFIHSIHETFARSLSNVLSTFLQSEMEVTLAGIRETTVGDFQGSLANPCCLITLRMHPEAEHMMLHFDSPTVLTLLDLLLGGSGTPISEPRELTEIEWSLLEEVSRVMLRALGESWRVVRAVEFVVESLASDPSLLACTEPAKSLFRISFQIQLGEQSGKFDIAVSPSFFHSAVPVQASQEKAENTTGTTDIERNAELLQDAEVELEVNLDGTRLSFAELLALREGQVVRLDHPLDEPVRAVVNGGFALTGHILSVGQKRAFQLEQASHR